MPKQRLDPETISQVAMTVVDDGGLDALSLSAVALHLGVGPSALYSHVDGLEGLHELVALGAMRNMVMKVRRAAIGVSGPDALQSLGSAYRDFARTHPGQFRSTIAAPESAGDELAAAHDELLEVFMLVYQGAGLDPADSLRAARRARSAIHGFVALEASTGSTPAHDDHYSELIDLVNQTFDM